jgi:hypothetical protein
LQPCDGQWGFLKQLLRCSGWVRTVVLEHGKDDVEPLVGDVGERDPVVLSAFALALVDALEERVVGPEEGDLGGLHDGCTQLAKAALGPLSGAGFFAAVVEAHVEAVAVAGVNCGSGVPGEAAGSEGWPVGPFFGFRQRMKGTKASMGFLNHHIW